MIAVVAFARRAVAALPPRSELLVASGIVLVAVGAAMVYAAAGVIVGGAAVAVWGIGEARAESRAVQKRTR